MSSTLYSPRFSDDVVRALYREGQRRRMSMTRLADLLLRQSLDQLANPSSGFLCGAEAPEPQSAQGASAA